jgi:hypothetical protein
LVLGEKKKPQIWRPKRKEEKEREREAELNKLLRRENINLPYLSFTAFGRLVPGFRMRIGSKWVQYQAPLPLMTLVQIVIRPL